MNVFDVVYCRSSDRYGLKFNSFNSYSTNIDKWDRRRDELITEEVRMYFDLLTFPEHDVLIFCGLFYFKSGIF